MAAALPYIAAAGSAAINARNQQQTLKRQDQEAATGIRTQAEKQREADARVQQEIDSLSKSNPEAERKASADAFMEQLQRNRAAAVAPGVDAASNRYNEDVAAQTDASNTQAARIADLMSRISAPELQRQREAQGFGRLTTDIGQIGRQSAGENFLTQLRLRAIQPNPWISAASDIAGGYANARAGTPPANKKNPYIAAPGQLIDTNVNPVDTRGLS